MSDFNSITGNSDRNPWCVGCARIDLATMRLLAPSPTPLIEAGHVNGGDIAFVADPFRVRVKDAVYVFAEAWSRSARRGQIAAFRLDAGGQVVDSHIVLAEPFHLSYPCVFEHAGTHYMLPEAWESGGLVLYRARRFPWEWERASTLVELDYADPQIFVHEKVWYIFLNTDPLTNACAAVFWAESLLGGWRPHPQNPATDGDLRGARSAGPLVRHGGRILRFSQDCRCRYGQDVFASTIVALSPLEFRALPVGHVRLNRPAWAKTGFHHLDVFFEDGVPWVLFDGYTGVSEPEPQQLEAEVAR